MLAKVGLPRQSYVHSLSSSFILVYTYLCPFVTLIFHHLSASLSTTFVLWSWCFTYHRHLSDRLSLDQVSYSFIVNYHIEDDWQPNGNCRNMQSYNGRNGDRARLIQYQIPQRWENISVSVMSRGVLYLIACSLCLLSKLLPGTNESRKMWHQSSKQHRNLLLHGTSVLHCFGN